MKIGELLGEMLVGAYDISLDAEQYAWRVTLGDKAIKNFYFEPRNEDDKQKEKKNAVRFVRALYGRHTLS